MLSEYEKVVAVWRISRNRIGLKHNEIKWYQVKEALLDPKSWLVWLMGASVGKSKSLVAVSSSDCPGLPKSQIFVRCRQAHTLRRVWKI